jgi:hypothetical protein
MHPSKRDAFPERNEVVSRNGKELKAAEAGIKSLTTSNSKQNHLGFMNYSPHIVKAGSNGF